MIRRLLIILLFALGVTSSYAQYSIHSLSGDIKVESGGKVVAATIGKAVRATDLVIIPDGGKVEIFNSVDKRVYTSIKPGKTTVTKLIIDARGMAKDNRTIVTSGMNKASLPNKSKEKVFDKKGMTKRSLTVYDPYAEETEEVQEAQGAPEVQEAQGTPEAQEAQGVPEVQEAQGAQQSQEAGEKPAEDTEPGQAS